MTSTKWKILLERLHNLKIYRASKQKRTVLSNVKTSQEVEYYLEDLNYDSRQKRLEFNLIKKVVSPIVTRYMTKNHLKIPIYGDVDVSLKTIKKFNKVIVPIRFLEQDILNLDYLTNEFRIQIIEAIGLIPKWRQKELKLLKIEKMILDNAKKIRSYHKEKLPYQLINKKYDQVASNFWLRFLLAFFSFGLSFLNYISKRKARIGREMNLKIHQLNEEHKMDIDQKNAELKKEITKYNDYLSKQNDRLALKYEAIEQEEITLIQVDEQGWINLRQASIFNYQQLINKKGVYIIWNKTKNKYYVGQSKNLNHRLKSHFNNEQVHNIIFAKDWFEKDQFYFRYYFCETKDELDKLERNYIEKYDAFKTGYNKTSGNI